MDIRSVGEDTLGVLLGCSVARTLGRAELATRNVKNYEDLYDREQKKDWRECSTQRTTKHPGK